MKSKKIWIIVLAVVMLVVFAGCNSVSFMSDKERNNLVSKYGTPQAEVVLEYTVDEEVVTLTLTYDLLLDKAPITVVNFINLVEQGYYNAKTNDDGSVTSLIFDNRIQSTTNAWIAGRYTYTIDSEDKTTYRRATELDYTIAGEFVQNGYVLPVEEGETDEEITDGNAKFSMFSLAMYHDNTVSDFNGASSAFFLTTDSRTTENYKNYAVFAQLSKLSVEVKQGDTTVEYVKDATQVPSSVVDDFDTVLDATRSTTVTNDSADGENTSTESVTMLQYVFRIVSIKMVDNNDYSTLPTNYVIR